MIAKREDNLYVFEIDLQHPAVDEFTAVAVAGFLGTQDPFQHCANDVEKTTVLLRILFWSSWTQFTGRVANPMLMIVDSGCSCHLLWAQGVYDQLLRNTLFKTV